MPSTALQIIKSSEANNPLYSPVGQLVEVGQVGEVVQRVCTGANVTFTYGEELLANCFLTAGHCLSDTCYLYAGTDLRKWRISYNYVLGCREELVPINKVLEHGTCTGGTDFALLDISSSAYQTYGTLPIQPITTTYHQRVTVVQHPSGMTKYFSEGTVKGVDTEQGEIDHTANTYPGSSGSPVIAQDTGRVFAVHVRGDQRAQKHHYAVTIENIVRQSQRLRQLGIFSPTVRAHLQQVPVLLPQQAYFYLKPGQ